MAEADPQRVRFFWVAISGGDRHHAASHSEDLTASDPL